MPYVGIFAWIGGSLIMIIPFCISTCCASHTSHYHSQTMDHHS